MYNPCPFITFICVFYASLTLRRYKSVNVLSLNQIGGLPYVLAKMHLLHVKSIACAQDFNVCQLYVIIYIFSTAHIFFIDMILP